MALETVNSDKTKTVADKLSTMAMDNGAYWYEYQGPNADLDTTGWAMEALSVAGRSTYDAAISKAYTFVQSKLNSNTARNIRCQHKTKHFRYIKQYSFCK